MGNYGNKQTEDSDIDRTPENAEFIEDLVAYHRQRGTHLQKEPALGPRRISLLKLYRKILGYGGYDKVSDTPLMWRKIADEYHVPAMSNAGMPAYILKSIYYKFLAYVCTSIELTNRAYEIERHQGRKAPPPELLEHQTARGGAITSRPEIINPPPPKAPGEVSTGKLAKSTPQPRSQQHSQPQYAPVATVQSLEYVRPQKPPAFVRAAYTATAGQYNSNSLHDNNTNTIHPQIARSYLDQHKEADESGPSTSPASLGRAALALKSGIESEMIWATSHLIKASYELADDLILEKIGGLTEVLLASIQDGIKLAQAPDAVSGNRKRSFARASEGDIPFSALASALVLRNVTLQTENAKFVARLPTAQDILFSGLSLSDDADHLEMRQYCVEICDALLPYLAIQTEDEMLYAVLVEFLASDDRSEILLALRALARFSLTDDKNTLLQDIDQHVISRLIIYTQLEDREMLLAVISFFFQYTTYKANLVALTKNEDLPLLLKRLNGLMTWQAESQNEEILVVKAQEAQKVTVPTVPPPLPDEIVRELLTFPEPDRAIHWMRACFEEDKEQSVTQILLWQSYRTLFTPFSLPSHSGQAFIQGKPLLQAADVIKMVGNAFTGATAMVVNSPTEGQKFIIRGIKCREQPLTPSGKSYVSCKWTENGSCCSAPFATEKDLYGHLLEKHIPAAASPYMCRWAGCRKISSPGEENRRKVANHLRVHLPDKSDDSAAKSGSKNVYINVANERTARTDKGEARGLASTAALTLRNIATTEPEVFDNFSISTDCFDNDLLRHATLNPSLTAQAVEILALKQSREPRE